MREKSTVHKNVFFFFIEKKQVSYKSLVFHGQEVVFAVDAESFVEKLRIFC